ncbi:exopolyphosphatase / guanosine-5'-triphosphate,3'-diphosphate pyrophosphatase [Candidatus Nanopelagicus abundans]|uniref:Exopolyphosphatase / guanosine-5'-triphosphate,3'-diphosphate pyrophosphatase n=1 Tax=Candidatus Nanopelagicus abundans TaxID=1884916 RepID=A0A249L576_9ACTN|nr:Ppx/GppA phosphatase family protein [Candidatus Nanopelagicus abundans]ASY24250.1 exopolyphosphatase / guanosine-5'-triphosphate,3'-diphosphate pyrophosphatase [Candidatus Nanopelagicus abundans]
MSQVAVIDCGTNSIRLLIAEISGSTFKEVIRTMEIVRLGQGVDENKAFHPDAINRTLLAVKSFKEIIDKNKVDKIRFCATSATRDAMNRNLFIDGVRDILNVQVEVIPGEEEAALSFTGATYQLDQGSGPFLVVDIGGGSTEFVYGDKKVISAKSVNIGCVRMSERHLINQPPTMDQITSAIVDIDIAITQAAVSVPINSAKSLIAVAGTATTVAAAALDLSKYDRDLIHLSKISADKVHKVAQMFQSMNKSEISALPYMHEGRVDVITAGSLVLSRVMAATGVVEFVASESDILDGMAFSLIN